MEGTDGISYTEFTPTPCSRPSTTGTSTRPTAVSSRWAARTSGEHHRRHRPDPTPHRGPRPRPHGAPGDPGRRPEVRQKASTGRSGCRPRTSPYRFFQYWMQIADADVERFLLQLTLLPVDEARHRRRPRRGAGPPGGPAGPGPRAHDDAARRGGLRRGRGRLGRPVRRQHRGPGTGAALDLLAGEVPCTELPRRRWSAPTSSTCSSPRASRPRRVTPVAPSTSGDQRQQRQGRTGLPARRGGPPGRIAPCSCARARAPTTESFCAEVDEGSPLYQSSFAPGSTHECERPQATAAPTAPAQGEDECPPEHPAVGFGPSGRRSLKTE